MRQRRHTYYSEKRLSQPTHLRRVALWFSLAALALALPLMVNLVGRLEAEQRMRTEIRQLSQKVTAAEAELADVQRALEHAKSDAFLDEWARSHRWTLPGEIPVVPAADTEVDSDAAIWWQRFVEKRTTPSDR
ncbi:MAG: hypothetical protein ACK4WM_02305 [Thermoflexales bacterium]